MESKDFSFKKNCLQILPLPLILQSVSKTIDQNYRKVSSLETKKCQECWLYIPDVEYYKFEKNYLFNKNDKKINYVCCQKCYNEKGIYHYLKVPIKRLKKTEFRLHTLGDYYIHQKTGKIIEYVPYKKIPINPNLHQLSENK